jgi:TRAP-type C4-dicarboxylate transport system substrate-binding protein
MKQLCTRAARATARAGAALLASFAISAAATSSASAQIVMKFGTQTQNDVQHEYMKTFKAKLEAASGKRIRVDLYPASQLGPFPRQLEGLRLGNIEAFTGPFEFYAGIDRSFQTTAMAGLFNGTEHMRKVADNPRFRKILEDLGDAKGVHVAAFIVYDMQSFGFKQPAKTLADFRGRRVRVLASEAEQAAVQALGAASIPMALPEVLPALQQGTIDGVSSGLTIFTSLRYYDAAPHLVETHLWGILTGVLISKVWLARQPKDLQKIILDTAKGVEAENHAWNVKNIAQARDIWTKNKGTFIKLSPAEQADAQKRTVDATLKVVAKYPPVKATYEAIRAVAKETK